jgi:hypothetical protein|nr:MAG TPA: tail protein [Caudoviricetes sp.]
MYNTSKEYKEIINSNEQSYAAYIELEDGTKIYSNENLSELKITDTIGNNLIGGFSYKIANLNVLNNKGYNLTDKKFKLFTGLILGNGKIEYIPEGTFIIAKPTDNNKGAKEIILEAKDLSYLFDIEYKREKFENLFPCTVGVWINSICGEIGVEFGSIGFPNKNIILGSQPYTDDGATYRNVVAKIAEACASFAKIGRDDKLYFKQLNNITYRKTLTVKEVHEMLVKDINLALVAQFVPNAYKKINLKNMFEQSKDDLLYGPINSVVASRIVADDGSTTEDVYIKDDESIVENGLCEYKIKENWVMDEKREEFLTGIFNSLGGTKFNTGKIEMVADPSIDIGDFIEATDAESNTTFVMPIMDKEINITNGIAIVESKMPSKTQTDYKSATTNKEKILKTEIKVNKLEGKITSFVEETSENLEQNYYTKTETNSQIDQKADSITQSVSKTYSTKEETDAKLEDYTKTEEFGTTIEQNWEHVKVAWNTISEFIQMEVLNNNASIAIRDDAKSLLMALDKAGQHFFENNKNFADMGVTTVKDGDYKGLMFVLMGEHSGTEIVPANNFMGFGYKAVVDGEEVVVPFLYFGKATASDENKLHVVGDAEFQGSIGVIGGTELGINYIKFANDFYLLDSNQMPVFSVYTNNEGTYTMDFGMNKLVADNVINSPTTMQIISDDYLASFFNKDGTQLTLYKENSDKRLKKNIKETTKKALDYIKQIKHFTYTWKNSNEKVDIGYVAQELEKVNKNFIRKHTYKTQEGKEDYDIQINTTNLLALVTKSIQEQQNEIEALKKEIEILKRGEKNE